jgi:hypothetical protein
LVRISVNPEFNKQKITIYRYGMNIEEEIEKKWKE